MTQLLVRFARRQASWEGERSLEELQRLEFRNSDGSPDLKPSVYLVADQEHILTQTYAEHCATPPIKPEQTTIGIDTNGCVNQLSNTDGSPRFVAARESHREYELNDLPTLLGFVGRLRDRAKARHIRVVTRERVVAYARARVAAGDAEWIAIALLAERDWLAALRRFIPQPANE